MGAHTSADEGDPVSKPLVVIKNWAIEQVAAIHSVTRPAPTGTGHLR